jgi:hypothetical protein
MAEPWGFLLMVGPGVIQALWMAWLMRTTSHRRPTRLGVSMAVTGAALMIYFGRTIANSGWPPRQPYGAPLLACGIMQLVALAALLFIGHRARSKPCGELRPRPDRRPPQAAAATATAKPPVTGQPDRYTAAVAVQRQRSRTLITGETTVLPSWP